MKIEKVVRTFTKLFEAFLANEYENWKKSALISYDDLTPIDINGNHFCPIIMNLAIQNALSEHGKKPILILNIARPHVNDEEIRSIIDFCNRKGFSLYYFGLNPRNLDSLQAIARAKIELKWVTSNAETVAKIIEDASPVVRTVDPEELKMGNLNSLSKLLIEKLGPPSMTEELKTEILSADKAEIAADVLSTLAILVSPTTAITKGLKYAWKFIQVAKKRRAEEMKEYYKEWREKIEKAFSIENLRELFVEESVEFETGRPVVILTDAYDSLLDFTIPILIQNILQKSLEDFPLIIDYASPLLRMAGFREYINDMLKENHVILNIITNKLPYREYSVNLIKTFLEERAIIIDIASWLLDEALKSEPASVKARIQKLLSDTIGKSSRNAICLLLLSKKPRFSAKLMKIKIMPGILDPILDLIRFFQKR